MLQKGSAVFTTLGEATLILITMATIFLLFIKAIDNLQNQMF